MPSSLCFVMLLVLASVMLSGCGRHEPRVEHSMTTSNVAKAQISVERSPDSPIAYVNLATVLLKEARKTGDFSLTMKAEEATTRALELDPADIPARKLEASLHLANHRFSEAIVAASKLRDELSSDSFVYGVLTDAYMETGDYAQAVTAAQKMVDLKPGTASYSRVAQIRSLHGDHAGAVEMFIQAARASDPNDKETRGWCLVQVGDEYWKNGKYAEAEKVYDEALTNFPGYFLAQVSKGRVRASSGDHATAERLLIEAQAQLPNANAALLLGDIYALSEDIDRASTQYDKFDRIQEELGDAADHKRLVISWADRGKVDKALEMALSEYAAEKSIHSADLLAWCLFKAGRPAEARPFMQEAMRLGTNDARMLFHAGMIAKANNERREAKQLLSRALKLNPKFDLIQANEGRVALNDLQ